MFLYVTALFLLFPFFKQHKQLTIAVCLEMTQKNKFITKNIYEYAHLLQTKQYKNNRIEKNRILSKRLNHVMTMSESNELCVLNFTFFSSHVT